MVVSFKIMILVIEEVIVKVGIVYVYLSTNRVIFQDSYSHLLNFIKSRLTGKTRVL